MGRERGSQVVDRGGGGAAGAARRDARQRGGCNLCTPASRTAPHSAFACLQPRRHSGAPHRSKSVIAALAERAASFFPHAVAANLALTSAGVAGAGGARRGAVRMLRSVGGCQRRAPWGPPAEASTSPLGRPAAAAAVPDGSCGRSFPAAQLEAACTRCTAALLNAERGNQAPPGPGLAPAAARRRCAAAATTAACCTARSRWAARPQARHGQRGGPAAGLHPA